MYLRAILFLMCVVELVAVKANNNNADSTSRGVILLDSLTNEPVQLSCLWEFYPNQLITSNQMDGQEHLEFINVPSWWTEGENEQKIQFATYRLKVIAPGYKINEALALTMPDVYCSYYLWVNNTKLGGNGRVGNSPEASQPQWKPDTYSFRKEKDTIDIVIQISNFYHSRTGISRPILIGKADQLLKSKREIEFTDSLQLFVIGVLCLLGGFFFFHLKNNAFLFYAFLCFSWMLRSAFSNHYQIVQWFPDINWNLVVRAEYMGIYLSTLFGLLLLSSVFSNEVNKLVRIFFIVASVCFTLFTVFMPPKIFTIYVQLYLGLSTLLLIYIFIIVLKAYVVRRKGSGFLLCTAIMGIMVFGYVILCYQGFFQMNEMLFNGMFIVQFLLTFITIYRRVKRMGTDKEDFDRMTFDNYVESRP